MQESQEAHYDHKLTKISVPGYELQSSSIEVIFNALDHGICDICKGYEKDIPEMDDYVSDLEYVQERRKKIDAELEKDYDDRDHETMDDWRLEIIYDYMSTACGMEYELSLNQHTPPPENEEDLC